MIDTSFYGQQDGERILFEARPDKFGLYISLAKIVLTGIFLLIVISVLYGLFPDISPLVIVIIVLLGLVGASSTAWVLITQSLKNITYITDRRVIRFVSTSPWAASNSRSLFWDEVVKVKTINAGWLLRMRNIGSIVVHARTTTMAPDPEGNVITSDDLLITNVAYYGDLGNYMDKILYLYKKEPEQLKTLRPFISKPKGQRY